MTISSKTQSLPVIDFSVPNLEPETLEWDMVRVLVRKALEEYRCFEVLFDGVSMDLLRKALFEASKEVFDLPIEAKLSAKSEKLNSGYACHVSDMPLFEGMGLASRQYYLQVRRMIMESFGLEKYVDEHLNSAKNRFHLFKYKGLDENEEEKVGIEPHIDRHFLTILCQNDVVDGLDIKTKDGQEWIKTKPSQDSSFLVIAGASLHVLLNGEVYPALHRVVITGKKDRYVAGLFLRPNEGLVINAPKEIIDDEHPRLYKPYNFEDYFKCTYKDIKKRDLASLKDYCAL